MNTSRPVPTIGTPFTVILALLAVQVLFGIHYVASKVVVSQFPPLLWASARILFAAAMMVGIALLSRRPMPRGRSFFLPLVGYALLGAVINQGAFLVGLQHTTSTNSSILNTLIPVFTLIAVTMTGRERVTRWKVLGFTVALIGVLLIHDLKEFSLSDATLLGDALTVLNCLSYGIFLAISKKFFETHDRIWTTAWLFIYGSIGLTLIALPDWFRYEWTAPTGSQTWIAILYAVLGGTVATYFLNFWALARAKSSQVALFIYVQPVVTMLLVWVLFGEMPTTRSVIAGITIFVGMLLAMIRTDEALPAKGGS